MANLKGYIDAPLFYDDTELSASLLNIIRDNSESIKNAVLIPQPAFDIHRSLIAAQNSTNIWWGGFQFRTGLTTATMTIYSKQQTGGGNHLIKIYFDDVEVDSYDAAVGGVNVGGFLTRSISISARGYTDKQIITVRVVPVVNPSGDATKNVYYVKDAYVEPLSNITEVGSWPGNPSFVSTTDVNATNLNQLANASDYLATRLGSIPMPLSMGYIQWMGTNNPKYPNFRYFTARATNGNNRLRTNVYYRCQQPQAYIDLDIGGYVTSSGPYTTGQQVLIEFDVDMIAGGLSYNVDYLSVMSERVTIAGSPSDGHGGWIFSRVDNGPIRMGATSYSVTTVRPENLMRESLTYNQVKTRLNNISNDIALSYTAMGANPRVFDRGVMFRNRYAINQAQSDYWETVFVPSIYRQGDVLWVKGQGLKISYGSVTLKPKSDAKPNDVWEYEFQYESDLLDGDKITQQFFYLDQFEFLYPGMRYFITGKIVHYAAEHLR